MKEPNLFNIREDVVSTLKHIEEKLKGRYHSRSTWTNEIFTELTRIAYEDYGLRVYGKSNYDTTSRGWLYDLVWYLAADQEGKEIEHVHLALECEWTRNWEEIRFDFNKLLQAKATLKVMICDSNSPAEAVALFKNLHRQYRQHSPDDYYLLAVYDDTEGFNTIEYLSSN